MLVVFLSFVLIGVNWFKIELLRGDTELNLSLTWRNCYISIYNIIETYSCCSCLHLYEVRSGFFVIWDRIVEVGL